MTNVKYRAAGMPAMSADGEIVLEVKATERTWTVTVRLKDKTVNIIAH